MGTADSRSGFRVTVDDREVAGGLVDQIAVRWSPTFVGRLVLSDVEIGRRVLVERKTVPDFVASFGDGRLFQQAAAIARGCSRPLLVVEGEEAYEALGLSAGALRGVLLTLLVGFRLPVLRTASTAETAEILTHLAAHEARRHSRHAASGAPTRATARTALDVLSAIPGVGDRRARVLVSRFGSVRDVMGASEADLDATPGIGPSTARAVRASGDAAGTDPEGPAG